VIGLVWKPISREGISLPPQLILEGLEFRRLLHLFHF
jgi:hypothetical protein